MSAEHDITRALQVLERALGSSSRVTRRRAICMLAHVDCANRVRWLEQGLSDRDESVSACALAVLAWIAEPGEAPWPQREDPRFDRVAVAGFRSPAGADDPLFDLESGSRWAWEYVVEVWRDDGLLVGSFCVGTCVEDDVHARRIALGQAVLASATGNGDAFDAGTAATFIVAKRSVPARRREPGDRRDRSRGAG